MAVLRLNGRRVLNLFWNLRYDGADKSLAPGAIIREGKNESFRVRSIPLTTIPVLLPFGTHIISLINHSIKQGLEILVPEQG